MLRVVFVLLLAVGHWGADTHAARAQNADIEATITAQIDAFRADDLAQAFTYASPSIQGLFETPENFGRMVQGGYPMVWRPGKIRYLELEERSGVLFQKVEITDAAGVVHVLEYQMIEMKGAWRINGVRLLANPPATA
ncbi:DUF4864 domain-containing protein [Aestuariivita sp.]|jgi:hypothetical protein|uniref:DUF4864 domain-containing protein n=1 Tax=Aestuariivita sp. TaxID=1872407 RepID=UPI00216E5F28|nr:DUF4864 domain-containing protein [Aestuariivita sp.]MCE8008411.1 DUF4864 domain-containing protein [Aestuariivita sp.]